MRWMTQGIHNLLQNLLILDDHLNGFIIFVIWHLINCSIHNFIILFNIRKKAPKRYLSFINMVDEDPHLIKICFDNRNDFLLSSNDLVPSSDDRHLFNIIWLAIQILFQVFFEFSDQILIVWVQLFIEACQNPQRFISHMWIELSRFVALRFENGLNGLSSSIIWDCGRRNRWERSWNRPVYRF